MAIIYFKGESIHTLGDIPLPGTTLPRLSLTTTDLRDVDLSDYSCPFKILNVVPSIDTGVCAASAREFDDQARLLPDTMVFTISRDLPFALSRFLQQEGLTNIIALSSMRDSSFGATLGLEIIEGPLRGLLARSVFILDGKNSVLYAELVPEIAQEPDYTRVIGALHRARKGNHGASTSEE